MRVEITEKRLSDACEETGRHFLQHEGDVVTVPDSLGQKWCKHGWAKDVDGKIETGERIVTGARLRVDSIKHKTTTSKVGD